MAIDYDPFALEHRFDPFPTYAALRAEAPVYWAERARTWVVSRYEDVAAILRDTSRFSSDAVGTVQLGATATDASAEAGGRTSRIPGNVVTYDPPDHTRLRSIVNRAFTPRRVEDWRIHVEEATDAAIGRMRSQPSFDVIADLAAVVPATVIAHIIGLRAEQHADFRRCANIVTAAMSGSKRSLGQDGSGARRATEEMVQHLSEVVTARMAEPGADMMSVLLRAQEGEALSPVEVLGFAGVLTFAGTETTTNLIGNAVRLLVERPEVRARIVADADLVAPLVEETLRWDSPVQYLFRRAIEAVEVAGVRIPANGIVTLLIGSANRDPLRWRTDAEEFDLDRDTSGHLAFGLGAHFCMGAALARMEAEYALTQLLPLLEKADFAGHDFAPIDSIQFRGVQRIEFRVP